MVQIQESVSLKDRQTLIFRDGRWYLRKEGKAEEEVYRSEAVELLMSQAKQHEVSKEAWLDVIKKSQPLLDP